MSTTSTSTTKKTSTSKAYNHEEIKVRRVNFIFNKDRRSKRIDQRQKKEGQHPKAL